MLALISSRLTIYLLLLNLDGTKIIDVMESVSRYKRKTATLWMKLMISICTDVIKHYRNW